LCTIDELDAEQGFAAPGRTLYKDCVGTRNATKKEGIEAFDSGLYYCARIHRTLFSKPVFARSPMYKASNTRFAARVTNRDKLEAFPSIVAYEIGNGFFRFQKYKELAILARLLASVTVPASPPGNLRSVCQRALLRCVSFLP
jgi:hypothetical protein